jgi:hypothetical protein
LAANALAVTPMVLLVTAAAAALASSSPAAHPVSATVQATATIRIVAAVRISFDGQTNPGAPAVRNAVLRSSDGTIAAAKLIEFQ